MNIDHNFVGPLHWKSQRREREGVVHFFVHSNKRKEGGWENRKRMGIETVTETKKITHSLAWKR